MGDGQFRPELGNSTEMSDGGIQFSLLEQHLAEGVLRLRVPRVRRHSSRKRRTRSFEIARLPRPYSSLIVVIPGREPWRGLCHYNGDRRHR